MDMPARLTTLLVAVLLAVAADAQTKTSDRAGGPPLYRVEIVVFAHNDASPTEEIFPSTPPAQPRPGLEYTPLALDDLDVPAAGAIDSPSAGVPVEPASPGPAPGQTDSAAAAGATGAAGTAAPPSGAAEGSADGAGAPGAEDATSSAGGGAPADRASAAAALIGPLGFTAIGTDGLKLDAAYAKLGRLGAYTPLFHAAWIQPALPEQQTRPIDMADLGSLNPSGTISLYASRYLHVNVDLRYEPTGAQWMALQAAAAAEPAGRPALVAGPGAVPGDRAPGSAEPGAVTLGEAPSGADALPAPVTGDALEEISLGPRLTIKASRRVGTGEVHYFDHPYFGLLVVVTPYEPKAKGAPSGGVPPAA